MESQSSSMSIARGCVPVVLIALVLVGGAFGFVVWRAGGVSKIQNEFVVNGALNLLQTHALNQRPDGIAEAELRDTFERARAAVSEGHVDLDGLYVILRDYEDRFKGTGVKPSSGEMREFLTNLDGAILDRPNVR